MNEFDRIDITAHVEVFSSDVFWFQVSLLGLSLVLLSFPEHASLNGALDSSSGRISVGYLLKRADTEQPFKCNVFSFMLISGTVYLGSEYVEEALQRAIELTDAAYARTSER